jgi:hypothetical protein
MDRIRRADGSCISVFGCNTFFALQNAGLRAWVNASNSAFHGGSCDSPSDFQRLGFDLNYTLSSSTFSRRGIGTSSGAVIRIRSVKGVARIVGFDIRHVSTRIRFSSSRLVLKRSWRVSGMGQSTCRRLAGSSLVIPLRFADEHQRRRIPTNYLSAALARCGLRGGPVGVGFDQTGNQACLEHGGLQSFRGSTRHRRHRGIVRGPQFFNMDLSLSRRSS